MTYECKRLVQEILRPMPQLAARQSDSTTEMARKSTREQCIPRNKWPVAEQDEQAIGAIGDITAAITGDKLIMTRRHRLDDNLSHEDTCKNCFKN